MRFQRGFVLSPQGNDGPTHIEIASKMQNDMGHVVSAGFVTHGTTGMECYGESFSLNVGARPEDSDLLTEQLILGRT